MTFTTADLSAFILSRGDGGAISDVNLWATTANADGYTLSGLMRYTTTLATSGYSVMVTNTTGAAAAISTLGEWAMILFGTVLAGAAALYVQRWRLSV